MATFYACYFFVEYRENVVNWEETDIKFNVIFGFEVWYFWKYVWKDIYHVLYF